MTTLKFFCYVQNNSGGVFQVDDKVTHYVIIEATDAQHANTLAQRVGIYFNGCDDGTDCSCCGDRWYPAWEEEEGDDAPLIYGKPAQQGVKDYWFASPGSPVCYIYRLDGTKETILQPATEAA